MLTVKERNGKIFEVSISKTSLRDKVRASKCRNGSVLDIVLFQVLMLKSYFSSPLFYLSIHSLVVECGAF